MIEVIKIVAQHSKPIEITTKRFKSEDKAQEYHHKLITKKGLLKADWTFGYDDNVFYAFQKGHPENYINIILIEK